MMKALEFLKADVPAEVRIFAVTGEESWLREQAVGRILAALPPDLEIQAVQGPMTAGEKGFELRDLLDDLRTGSLFGGERLVHLKEADLLVREHGEALARFVAEGEAVQRLIIEGRSLMTRGAKAVPKSGLLRAVEAALGLVIQCDPLYDTPFGGKGPPHQSPLSRWVQERATVHGRRISLEDAYLLHRLVGTGLRELDAELQKLAIYVKDRRTVTAEDIETAVGGGRLAPVFDLAEALARRDGATVLEQSAILFERGLMDVGGRHVRDAATVAVTLVAAVASRLRKVARVRELMDQGTPFEQAAAKVRHPVMFNDRLRSQVEAWKRPGDLHRIVDGLLDLDRGLKTGGGPPRVLFDRFVVEGLGMDRSPGTTAWRP